MILTCGFPHGTLDNGGNPAGVWRLASEGVESWLATVEANTWGTFRDIGKIRVGIKTCADKVFLPKSWDRELELLRPLTTHHIARRFRPEPPNRQVLYPHHSVDGKRQVVDLAQFPASRAYLQAHRATLESRSYVIEAGRQWYEIWVPQNPDDWPAPKLVFRDISEQPTFWMDLEGTVVNGDCYWLTGNEDLLWLDAELAQRMSDRAVRILWATDAGELLPRVAQNRDFFECRFCPWAERCWGLPGWDEQGHHRPAWHPRGHRHAR